MGVALTSAVTRMTRARARDARDTHDVRMTVRLRLHAREEASTRQHNEEMYKKVSTNSVQQSDATSR